LSEGSFDVGEQLFASWGASSALILPDDKQ
jgi:hypothetical protein